ncbi:condensation domain-containing protein [Rhizobium sp. L1K21]|uniref:condensation domain-containing protein n=1 Tax=Rhizobium sp. L1K21 TaxID=2954933 RepID=UPI0020939B26|nr:condensation domain-containing protein [Rhizobium sp. L1K21]MCO6187568.1 condensation domain-containing protein [Rhizobium sp. L1K21]
MAYAASDKGWMPLTLPQLDFWEEFCHHPHDPVSTIAHYLDITGDVDEAALLKAISQTVHEAEVLSIRIQVDPTENEPRQICDPMNVPEVEFVDLRTVTDAFEEALKRMRADMEARLDLRTDRLSCQRVYRVAQDRYLWYLRAHHIILDGYGFALIERRCSELYDQFSNGAQAGPPFHAFAHFIEEEEAYRAGSRHEKDSVFWRDYLGDADNLPVLKRDVEDYGAAGLYARKALDDTIGTALKARADVIGIGWPDLLVLLTSLYLHQEIGRETHEDQRELIVWLPFMSRWGSIGAHVPAMLVNILPFRVPVQTGQTLMEFLQVGAAALRKQRRHGRYRIEQIAMDQHLEDGSRFFFSPLINVLPFTAPTFPGCQTERHVLASGPADGFNLTFRANEDASHLTLEIDADPALTSKEQFERHGRDFPVFLKNALSADALERPLHVLSQQFAAA